MATYIERTTAIADALLNDIATAEQKTKLGDSFVNSYRKELLQRDVDPDTLTNEQKSRVFVVVVKRFVKNIIENYDPTRIDALDVFNDLEVTVRESAEADYMDEDVVEEVV